MGFIIKCVLCGNERYFTNESKKFEDKISVDVYTTGTFRGDKVESVDIDCENSSCQNSIEIKY